jgi:outer membrane protein insertion porin family
MRRYLGFIAVLMLFPAAIAMALGQEKQVLIIPLKIVYQDGKVGFSPELSQAFASSLARDGDLKLQSGHVYRNAVERKNVDIRRIARIARQTDVQAVVWGKLTISKDEMVLEIRILDKDQPKKPYSYVLTGKDLIEITSRLDELTDQIGTEVFKKPRIGRITVQGNKRFGNDAIRNRLNVKQGDTFHKRALGQEIRNIYALGGFEDVQIHADEASDGSIDLKIVLKERPSIREIEVEGNSVFTTDQIRDALKMKNFDFATAEKIRSDVAKLKAMYEKKGYYQPKIEYELSEVSPNEAELIFKIDEGEKSFLTELVFEGRKRLTEKELKKILTVKEKSWTWFLDESGTFTRPGLDENRQRLIAYYRDKGFINVQVGAPRVEIDGGTVTVTYPIREGDRFQVRKVDAEGELIVPADKLLDGLKVKGKQWYRLTEVADDIKSISKMYKDMGYAYADVAPQLKVNDDYDFVDVTYNVAKGRRVTVEKVGIRGNDHTRDKVIRRALVVSDGDLYNASAMEASKKRLEQMDFFDAVQMRTSPGSRPDLMNVNVEVVEKKTGSMTAGVGFSSQDGAQGNLDLKERNLLGLGIVLNGKGTLSARRNTYEGSISYPWLFDMPLSGTLRGYNTQARETNFIRNARGFSAFLGFPLYGLWNMTTGVSRDTSTLTNISERLTGSLTDYYGGDQGTAEKFLSISENALSMSLSRDTRNSSMLPTDGAKISVGSRVAGFGGDVFFTKYFTDASYYRRLKWTAVLKMRGSASVLSELGDNPIPFDRRLLLGGPQSIRGYKYGEIGPEDKFGNILGGDRAVFTNIECLVPIVPSMKLYGVAFFDAGNAWNASVTPLMTEVKAGFGLGIRWVSPMGPLRIEYGWKVSPEKDQERGEFGFSMGQLF